MTTGMNRFESYGPPKLDELPTPLQVTNRINYIMGEIRKAHEIVKDARKDHLHAKHAYLLAYKTDKLRLKGTISDREDQAQLDNWLLFEAMEIAEAAWEHAKEKRKDLKDELSALQTEAGLVKEELRL